MAEIFSEIFQYTELLLVEYYGWVLFLYLLIWLVYTYRKLSNIDKYMSGITWVFLEIKIDETNERSPLAMEQVFAAMHAIHTAISWGESYKGKIILRMSCEIVSLGGRVSYIVKIPDKYRNLFESSVFAQYPKAEIYEVEDYLKNLPRYYDPETADFEFFGVQMNKRKDGPNSVFPIRTYSGFEHKEQETFVDPLAGVIEVMSNLQPYELMATQIVIKPVQPTEWVAPAIEILDKLKGKPQKVKPPSWFDWIFLKPFSLIGDVIFSFLEPASEDKPRQKEEPYSMMQHLSEGEKQVISAAEHALTKIAFDCRVRFLYLAPKGKINKSLRVPEIIGAYRNFDEASTNGLKPDMGGSSTEDTFKVYEPFERVFIQRRIKAKRKVFYYNFRNREHWLGTGNKTILNTEELASLYHLPVSPNARVSQLESVKTIKTAPPSDLPVG